MPDASTTSDPNSPAAPLAIERMRKRPQFLACAKAPSCAKGAVVIQARPRDDGQSVVRTGFTATRKVGNAVVRNRARRRLREAARLLLPDLGRPGFDYVFIARGGTAERPWVRLLDDVKSALLRLAPENDGRAPAPPTPPAA
jgi:ribonuclease P protein component